MASVITIYVLVFIAMFEPRALTITCPPGSYVSTYQNSEICLECPDETFMPDSYHQETSCRPCDKIRVPELEILVSPCDKSKDAVIHCVDGYYRVEAENQGESRKCRKCTECPKATGLPCSTYSDTMCCPDDNSYDVVKGHNGVLECKKRPWFCRRGQYFDTNGYFCLPCPSNTYMPLDYHIQPECWNCREFDKYDSYRPLHSVIIHPCNSTHEASIRCKEGFFMNPNMGPWKSAIGCSPCTDCSTTDVKYDGRECSSIDDTVCCPHPDMIVVDTSDGPVCSAPWEACGSGQCLLYHTRNGATSCFSCFINTEVNTEHSTGNPVDPTNLPNGINEKSLPPDGNSVSETTVPSCNYVGHGFGFFTLGAATGVIVTLISCALCRKDLHKYSPAKWITKFRQRRRTEEAIPLHRTLSGSDQSELAQGYGNETDFKAYKKTCSKFQNHTITGFVGQKKFVKDDLPIDFRNERYLAYIKAMCDVTVRLRVSIVSQDRPRNDPYYHLRGLDGMGLRRFGNGLVFRVSKKYDVNNGENCPCKDCQVFPENALKHWAEFLVVTSAQIVFDETECGQTSCKLWYDQDEDPFQSPSLKGWKVKRINRSQDVCIMRCVSHDQEVAKKLEEKISSLKTLHAQDKSNRDDIADVNRHAVMISHPHGLSKRITQKPVTAVKERTVKKWTYHGVLCCPGSLGAPVCLLSKEQDRKILTTIYSGNLESKGFDLNSEM